jgi:uncharacterized protein (DUF1778 family)
MLELREMRLLIMTTTKETRLNIRITPEELAELKRFAESANMSVSEFVLAASRSYMGKTEGLEQQVLNLSKRLLEVERQLAQVKSLQAA